jgi:hypothetical protein
LVESQWCYINLHVSNPMRAIHVLFYVPQSDDHWLNHVVTKISPPYSHCDIQFENEVASSIYQNETVYMHQKSFSRLNYHRISLSVNEEEYQKIYSFCENACKNFVAFDPIGMVGTFIPFYNFRPPDKTFCSRYVCEALQASGRGEFKNMAPARTSPSQLHTELHKLKKSFFHIPNKRMNNLMS